MRANEFISEVNLDPRSWFGAGQMGGRGTAGGSQAVATGGRTAPAPKPDLGKFKRTPDGKIIDPEGQVVSPRTGDPYTKADVYRDTGKSPEFKSISPERSHYARTSQADRARDARHSANAEKYADELKAAEAQFKEKGDAASFGRILDILNRP
jgi:hypothetical protein